MKELTNEELNDINGGMVLSTKLLFLGGLITFIIGLIDGYIRPVKCNT